MNVSLCKRHAFGKTPSPKQEDPVKTRECCMQSVFCSAAGIEKPFCGRRPWFWKKKGSVCDDVRHFSKATVTENCSVSYVIAGRSATHAGSTKQQTESNVGGVCGERKDSRWKMLALVGRKFFWGFTDQDGVTAARQAGNRGESAYEKQGKECSADTLLAVVWRSCDAFSVRASLKGIMAAEESAGWLFVAGVSSDYVAGE